jgi:hypothetical protein
MPGLGTTDPANLEAQACAQLGFSQRLEQPQCISRYPGFGGSDGYPVWYREQQLQRFNAGEAIERWRGGILSHTSSCWGDVLSRAVLLAQDNSMCLPIHLACNKNAPFSVLRSLLDADKGKASIGMLDKWGGESPPPRNACGFAWIGILTPLSWGGPLRRPPPPHDLQQAPDGGGEPPC